MGRRRLPSLTGLRAFEAFAATGSMTAAAEQLCVTHGAISRQIRALEQEIGVRLVVGPRHRLEFTEAGRTLSAALTSAFDLIAAGLPGAGAAQELTVGCYATLAMKWLIPRLPEFLAEHPSLRLRIVEGHAPVEFSHGVQAAIRIEGSPWPEGSRTMPFMAHYQGPVLSPSLAEGQSPQTLLGLPRLHSETFREAWPGWAARAGVDLPPAAQEREFEHNSYMLEAAAAGLGMAVSPWAFAADDVARGRLVAPFGFEPVPARYVLIRPRIGENAAVDAFAAWLKRAGAATPAPPSPYRPMPEIRTAPAGG